MTHDVVTVLVVALVIFVEFAVAFTFVSGVALGVLGERMFRHYVSESIRAREVEQVARVFAYPMRRAA